MNKFFFETSLFTSVCFCTKLNANIEESALKYDSHSQQKRKPRQCRGFLNMKQKLPKLSLGISYLASGAGASVALLAVESGAGAAASFSSTKGVPSGAFPLAGLFRSVNTYEATSAIC